MSEWKEYKLGEISKFSQGIQVPVEEQQSTNFQGAVRFIRIVDYTNNDPKDIRYIADPGSKYIVEVDDLIMIRYGSQTAGKIARGLRGVIANNTFKISPDEELLFKGFLFYFLSQNTIYDYFRNSQSSSTMPAITFGQIGDLKIKFPSLKTQTAIAEILSSLDDKIELNNKINQELESLAQTLFKQWFIDFDFPNENGELYKTSGGEMVDSELGEIPAGWEVKEIENLTLKMNSGGTPSTRRNDYYDGNIKWYSTKELKDGFLFESERMISNIGLENSSAKIFPIDTVVMAIYAAPTVGRIGVLTEEAAFNQAALGFIAKEEIGYEYLFLLLKHLRNDLNNLANGAAQQNLNVGIVKNYKINYPTNDLFDSFRPIISPLFKSIKNNQIESYELIKTRDLLLPKLISGELEINENNN